MMYEPFDYSSSNELFADITPDDYGEENDKISLDSFQIIFNSFVLETKLLQSGHNHVDGYHFNSSGSIDA